MPFDNLEEQELPALAEGTSQTDSEGLYWDDSTFQDQFWEAVDVVSGSTDDDPGEGADGTEATCSRSAKRKRVVPEDCDDHGLPPPSSRNKGKGKAIALGSDDDALWAVYPSSQLEQPIATQPSFEFSEAGSSSTSMTSLSSSDSLKRKRSQESPLPLVADMDKAISPSSESEPVTHTTSAPLSEMVLLPPPQAGSSIAYNSSGFVVISHNKRVQDLMDRLNIAWGVQYEIARGVCEGRWDWNDVTADMLGRLIGSNSDIAPRVSSIILGPTASASHTNYPRLWEELDLEQAAILENAGRGLGLQGEWHGQKNWYGGKIQQILKIELSHESNSFSVRLERMQMTRSHRFARFLGSRRLLQMKLSGSRRDVAQEREFLMQKFVLCGRVFVPFSTKDGKVYLMETEEDYERNAVHGQGDQYRISLEDFVRWHNPMKLNRDQAVAKWATRFDLGLSTSIPALRFDPSNIFVISDICADHGEGKMPAEKIFTDGCGFMNRAALAAIAQNMGYAEVPAAVQGRVFGAKGLWALHPHDHLDGHKPKIWIRTSQLKIQLVLPNCASDLTKLHPAHFTFDLVAPAKVTVGTRLNRLSIINLAHNGVSRNIFANLMKACLEEQIVPLTRWDIPYAMPQLSFHFNKITGAFNARLQQFASGTQRALGHSRRRDTDEDTNDSSGHNITSTDPMRTRRLPSGKPLSIPEEVLDLIKAGFRPDKEPHLFNELRMAINWVMTENVRKCHTPIPNSADAFIIPDPFGVLNEGEIHFSSSRHLQDPLLSRNSNNIIGDVLLYRNPARLPSDIRKVRAVECAALERYTDVIVLPVTGSCSLASLLAGGDVDGDVAVCIWDRDIVNAFTNAPTTTTLPRTIVEEYFEPETAIELVSSVDDEIRSSPSHTQNSLQRCLLSGIAESNIGIYSNFHENAVYALGYDHDETLRLAHMFNILLDSRKTGYVVKAEVYRKDKRQYDRDPPACMADADSHVDHNPNHLRRASHLPKFILDELLSAGRKLLDQYLQKYDENRPYAHNIHISKLHERMESHQGLKEEVQAVRDFVKSCHDRWNQIWMNEKPGAPKSKEKKKLEAEEVWALVVEYMRGPPEEKTSLLRATNSLTAVAASYAYSLAAKFAFTVAFRDLCTLKATEPGSQISPTTEEMAVCFTIAASVARIFDQSNSGTI